MIPGGNDVASENIRDQRTDRSDQEGALGRDPRVRGGGARLPPDKRFHRFFPLDESDFYFPAGRTAAYTIIEISMFEGRSVEAKKRLIGLLFERISARFGISPQDIEITIFETPKHN